jgi:hypothetical protein
MVDKMDLIIIENPKPKPKCYNHHWHYGTPNGKEGEIWNSGNPWFPAFCCHCHAIAHIQSNSWECGKDQMSPAITVNAITNIRVKDGRGQYKSVKD